MKQDLIINRQSSVFCSLSSGVWPLSSVICRLSSVNCPPSSTSVENPLQITYFLCKTNPISKRPKLMQTQYVQGIMKISRSIRAQKQTQNKPNSNPITERVKLMQSVYLQRIKKKNAALGYEKTNPIQTQFKPNQTQFPSRNAKNVLSTCPFLLEDL